VRKKIKKNGIVWHIYHTILAIELALVVAIEFTELMMSL
jgi:hypothetical protein